MRPTKYNFIPEHQLGNESGATTGLDVTIQKTMSIYFSPFNLRVYELEGKFIRIFADIPNKTISWREITGPNLEAMKNLRRITANKIQHSAVLSVGKILKKMGITKKMLPFKNVPVTNYKGALDTEEFFVIDLRDYVKE